MHQATMPQATCYTIFDIKTGSICKYDHYLSNDHKFDKCWLWASLLNPCNINWFAICFPQFRNWSYADHSLTYRLSWEKIRLLESDHNKVTVWCVLCSVDVIEPFFFKSDGETTSVNLDQYLTMLKRSSFPYWENEINVWFLRDRAKSPTSGVVLVWLKETFGERFISYKTDPICPLHSPGLSYCTFLLGLYEELGVYHKARE